MGISKRLKMIADQVTPGLTVADIGTDHGFVPVYLIRNNISPRVIASDKSPGSLAKARESAEYFHIQDKMECRLSDGFCEYEPGDMQCAVISGMGGILMVNILTDGSDVVASLQELVLSPHRDADLVRRYITEAGFDIVTDITMEDKGKSYVIIKCVRRD